MWELLENDNTSINSSKVFKDSHSMLQNDIIVRKSENYTCKNKTYKAHAILVHNAASVDLAQNSKNEYVTILFKSDMLI